MQSAQLDVVHCIPFVLRDEGAPVETRGMSGDSHHSQGISLTGEASER